MAGKTLAQIEAYKKARKKSFYDLDATLLKPAKIKRVLETLDWDPERFADAYVEDGSRVVKAPKRIPKAVENAVASFQRTGDFAALKAALKTKNDATANATVRRVLQARAKK